MGSGAAQVDFYYSTQSIYCYCLIDRMIWLRDQGVEVQIRPVLGGVIREPERYKDRCPIQTAYFKADAARTAARLGLPVHGPDPSPIDFKSGPGWQAQDEQPRNAWLNQLFVSAVVSGGGFAFLDHVMRGLWAGTVKQWDQPGALAPLLASAGFDHDTLIAAMSPQAARDILDANAAAMIAAGHWGVPLMVYRDEPFYGQDRFDHLTWRMAQHGDLSEGSPS